MEGGTSEFRRASFCNNKDHEALVNQYLGNSAIDTDYVKAVSKVDRIRVLPAIDLKLSYQLAIDGIYKGLGVGVGENRKSIPVP